ncbi:glycosyltransferase [Thiotrichales bacterium HSG1]|nr:glycosyltransferase [Thiotrichales bacterium HSG1]
MQIIVLGMHRSGTSMVARLLNMMGAYFGPDNVAMQPTKANPKGYWEREDIWHLNDAIFRKLELSWDNISDFDATKLTTDIQQEFAPDIRKIVFSLDANRPWMIKDPRLCLLLNVWKPLLEVPVCVYVYRDPIQVAQSLTTRENANATIDGSILHNVHLADYSKDKANFPINLGVALWEKYTLNALASSENLPRILISFHDLFANPIATANNLYKSLLAHEVQGLRLPSDKEILAYLEPKLCHAHGDNNLQKKHVNSQQTKLIKSFQKGKIFKLNPLPTLSAGASEILVEYQNKLLAANKILGVWQEVGKRDKDIIRLNQEVADLNQKVTERDQETLNQQEHFSQLREHIEKLEQALQTKELENQQLQQQVTNSNQEILTKVQQIDSQTQQINSLTEQFEHQRHDIQRLTYWISALDNDIAAVFNSLTWRSGNLLTQIALKLMFRKADFTAKDHILVTMREIAEHKFHSVAEHLLPKAVTQELIIDRETFRPSASTLPDIKTYELWYDLHQCQVKELDQQKAQNWQKLPLISIVIPLFNSVPRWLEKLLSSVHAQTYSEWECILIDDASTEDKHLSVVEKWCRQDNRFRLVQHEQNKGVSDTSQTGVENARGTYICVVDHDDELEPQALFEVAKVINGQQPDVIYSDEMLTNEDGPMINLVFRPDFDYYFLLSHPYIVHLTVIKRDILLEVGGFTSGLTVSQDYDLLLRIAATTQFFVHIPKILYRWRTHTSSTGHQQAHNVMSVSQTALNNHLRLKGLDATQAWATEGFSFNFFRIRYKIEPVTVSIIIPTKDKVDLLKTCIESVLQKTFLPSGVKLEILVVDNGSEQPETLAYFEELKTAGHQVINAPGTFNFSWLNNKAVEHASGSLLLFMNNDIEVIEAGWLEAMVELMAMQEVAAVGAKLLYPDGLIQHAGVLLGINGPASHDHQFFPELENNNMAGGHNHALLVIRECMAVTAACMLVRRSAFDAVGGFDEQLAVGFGDTDLCLRLRADNHKCLFTPYARLIHHESATRGYQHDDPHPEDRDLFYKRWGDLIEKGDPFYNSNLQKVGKMFEPEQD